MVNAVEEEDIGAGEMRLYSMYSVNGEHRPLHFNGSTLAELAVVEKRLTVDRTQYFLLLVGDILLKIIPSEDWLLVSLARFCVAGAAVHRDRPVTS